MPADTTITQHADIKVLIPILQAALKGSEGALHLNMVGPIYIGGNKDNGQDQPKQIKQPAVEIREVGLDDLFNRGLTVKEFREAAVCAYFRVTASKHEFDPVRTAEALGINCHSLVYTYAKRARVTMRSKRRVGGLDVRKGEA